MKKTFSTLLFVWVSVLAFSQLNMTLTDSINYSYIPGSVKLSSLWGYIDPEDSTEYAAVGTVAGVSIVNLEDPYNVVEIGFVPDVNSQWREVKSFGHYIYAVTEGGGGLLVINMTDPDNITSTHWAPNIPSLGGTLNTIHSISVDEFGFLYLNGTNLNSGGVLFVDVSADDGNPVYVGKAPAVYCHDSYARNNILYTSDIYAGQFAVYDISDKSNPILLATQPTPGDFTHNTWLNDAGDVIFTTDEVGNAPVTSYDISDFDNIIELDQFRPVATLGLGVVPHNVHVWDDWLIVAYYTEGTIVVDGSKPDNLIEVGYFDSFVSQTAGFSGVWGVYPYFPSGLVIASDRQNGLMVYDVNYVRACWLEGTVTDASTGLPIQGATIHIQSTQANQATTESNGTYKTGQAIPGTFDVLFQAADYISKTVQATLENGVLTILDVQLEKATDGFINGQTIRAENGAPVAGAHVVIEGGTTAFSVFSDGNGNFSFPQLNGGEYTLYAGAWGYKHKVVNVIVNGNTQSLVLTLEKGYQDDFFFQDFGWTETHTSSSGWWERGEPVGTSSGGSISNPDNDMPGDIGYEAYVTGNDGGEAGQDDVDNGTVTLYSPVMDLSGYNQPILSYNTWFFNAGGNGNPNDALQVRITNGTDEVVLETITQSASQWRPASEFDLATLIPLTSNMQVIFETSDLQASGHLVEAAVDAFLVEDILAYPPFSASPTVGCGPLTVQFSDSSDSTATWQWTFEGGIPATSTDQNPVVVFNTGGSFDVTLTVVTNEGNSYTVNRPEFIVVNEVPAADFNFNANGNSVNFINLSTGGGAYDWNFGDDSNSSAANPVHSYSQPGTYTVTLTATNDCGTSSFSAEVEILAVPPTALFSVSSTEGCVPFTVQFTDTSLGAPDSWSWSFPGGTPSASSAQNPVVVYNEPGTYSAQLTVSNAAGTSQVTQSQFIEVGDVPVVDFTFSVDGAQVTFTNASDGATTYEWTFGDGAISTEENPVHTFISPGNYEVTLEAGNDCGFSVSTQTVVVELTGAVDLDETGYSMSAFPNPFQTEVFVKYELKNIFSEARLLVFNVLGEQTGNLPLVAANGTVRLGDEIQKSGVYFVRLVVDGKVGKTLRVVKI